MPPTAINLPRLLLCTLLLACQSSACRQQPRPPPPDSSPPAAPAVAQPPQLPSREPGPGRKESAAQLASARDEAAGLAATLRGAGIAAREIASVCDIRGYRLYRRRLFGQALAWFEQAHHLDPRFEPAIYNAARAAALLGQQARSSDYLGKLQALATPLSRGYLARSHRDPDLQP